MTQTQQTFKPGDEVIITVPEGTLADEVEPGGEYIDEGMLTWTEGHVSPSTAEVTCRNSILVYNSDGSDYWYFPVSWLKLKNPPEDVQETKEKKLPGSFRFKTAARSDYKADWNESCGWFFISWNDGINSTTYTKEQAEGAVRRGNWVIIEEPATQITKQATKEPQEQQQEEITLESLDKQIQEAQSNLNHLESLREVFLNARALGYKLTKA